VLYGPEEAINEGIDIEKTEIVYDPLKAKALYLELVDSLQSHTSDCPRRYLGSGHHSSFLALWNGSKSGSE
jgi:hypothetical protein